MVYFCFVNYFKSIAVGTMALFLFIGTVGVNIFSHACEEDGVKVSYFIPNEEVCGKHNHEEEKIADDCDDCCCDEQEDDGCCSTSTELVKVELDFLNKLIVTTVLIQTDEIKPIWGNQETVISTELLATSGSDPPPKLGQDILIDIQKWVI